MKSEAIQLIKGPYNFHYAKTPKSKVFLPLEMDDAMYNKIYGILSTDAQFDLATKYLGKPMQFYPQNCDTTLMHFGTYTSFLENDELTSKIAEKMYSHLQRVLKTDSIN